jgi:hypothetical protein
MTNYLDFERPLAEIESCQNCACLGEREMDVESRQRRLIKGRRFVGQPLRRPDPMAQMPDRASR